MPLRSRISSPSPSRPASPSAHSKRIFQGLRSGQTLPTKAVKKLKPTHQIIQTNVGAKL